MQVGMGKMVIVSFPSNFQINTNKVSINLYSAGGCICNNGYTIIKRKKIKQMEKCINDLIKAIKQMDNYCIDVIGQNQFGDALIQSAELSFASELYHQFKVIISRQNRYYNGLQLHFDLGKESCGGIRPDMVLHHSPIDYIDQRLYIEIKTSFNKSEFERDLEKLFNAVKESYLNYKNAVFIVAKVDKNKVIKIIRDFIQNKNLQTDNRLSKIYLINVENKENITIEIFTNI